MREGGNMTQTSEPLICHHCWPKKTNHYGPCEHALQIVADREDRIGQLAKNTGGMVPAVTALYENKVAKLEERIRVREAQVAKDTKRLEARAGGELAYLDRAEKVERELEAQKDEAYRERDQLVAALSKLFPSSLERHPEEDATWDADWRWIVFFDLPTGQAT